MSDDPKLDKANEDAKVCARFLSYILEQGYMIVDSQSVENRAARTGDEPGRLLAVLDMSTPLNPLRLVYDHLGLECPTSHGVDMLNAMRENYRRLSGEGKR